MTNEDYQDLIDVIPRIGIQLLDYLLRIPKGRKFYSVNESLILDHPSLLFTVSHLEKLKLIMRSKRTQYNLGSRNHEVLNEIYISIRGIGLVKYYNENAKLNERFRLFDTQYQYKGLEASVGEA
jgi:hypothetical protein